MTTDDHNPPTGGDAPPTGGPTPPPQRSGDGFFDSVRRLGLYRSDDRWVGGVAGGLAQRFGLDPLLVRGLLVLSFFLTGAGIVVYAIAWALLPEQRDGRIHLQQAVRGDFDVALLGAVVALVVGIAWNGGVGWWSGYFDWVDGLIWIAVWVAIVWVIVKLVRSRRPRTTPPARPGYGPVPPQPGPWQTGPSQTGPSPAAPGDPHFVPAPPAPYLSTPATPAPYPTTYPATPPRGAATASAPYLSAPVASRPTPLPAPAAPPLPPMPVRRGPGATTVGVVLGLVLLGGALLLVADRMGELDLPLWPTWLGVSIVVLGLGIVVCGLRSRKGGGLTFLAVVAVIAGILTWPLAGGPDPWDWWDVSDDTDAPGTTISNGTVVPRTIEQAEDGVQVSFGSAVVDLTELDLDGVSPGDPVVVPISMTAGSTTVLIPDGEAVAADVNVRAGNANWRVDDQEQSVNTFTDAPARFTTQEVSGADTIVLLLDLDVRAGDLTIKETR